MIPRPMGDGVLVEIIQSNDEKTSSGIILTEQSKTHQTGKVVAIGNGLFTQTGDKIPMTVKVDDIVYVHPGGGKDIKLNDVRYKLFRESDLLLVD
jgi:chaperonin GroES